MSSRFSTALIVALSLLCVSAGCTWAAPTSVDVLTSSVAGGAPPDLGIGCPSPPGAPHGTRIWIHVTRWCSLPGVRGQAQFKLQMQIYNRGKHTLGIGQEHMRLIVKQFNVRQWSPPRYGRPTTERPFRTSYLGEHVWAVPANAEDAYDPILHVPGDLTFATHWGQNQLAPGMTFNPSFHSGDLVFYVPDLAHDPHGRATSADVLGIAYVYGREIVVMCPTEHWGPKVPAGSF